MMRSSGSWRSRPRPTCTAGWHRRSAGVRRSRIVLNLTPGNVVTVARSDTMFVVTEYGLVNLNGKSVPEGA